MSIFSFRSFRRLNTYLRKPETELELPLISKQLRQDGQDMIGNQKSSIGDASSVPQNQRRSWQRQIGSKIEYLFPVIDPRSNWLLLWNLLLMLTILYNFVQIPIVILIINFVFNDPLERANILGLDIAILVLYLIDMVFIRWRVGFYRKERIVTDYKEVFMKYLTELFLFDLVSYCGYAIFVIADRIVYIKLIFYFKAVPLLSIDHQIQKKISMYILTCSIYKFMRLVVDVVLLTSLSGCIFFFVDYKLYLERGYYWENNFLWLTSTIGEDIIQTWPWYVWYEYALYFGVQTTVSCGYGAIVARNPIEVLVILVMININVALFAYFTTQIIKIVEDYRWRINLKRNQMLQLQAYMRGQPIRHEQKMKLQSFVYKKMKKPFQEIQIELLDLLSQKLREEFILVFSKYIIDHLPLMKQLFEGNSLHQTWSQFARYFAKQINNKYLVSGQLINRASKEQGEVSLVFIARGVVSISNSINFCQRFYKEWEYVGQREFFLGGKVFNTTLVKTFTRVYYFRRDSFLKAIKQFPIQNQIFRLYFDEIRINNRNSEALMLTCSLCEQCHIEQFCPLNKVWRDKLPKFKQQDSMAHDRCFSDRSKMKSRRKVGGNVANMVRCDARGEFKRYYPYYNMGELIFQ